MATLLAVLQEAAGHAQDAADHAEGVSGPFSIEPGLIVWTWIVFIALFLLLRKYAWPAIVRATEERERKIALQLETAERQHAEARALLEQHKQMLGTARQEAHALLQEAKDAAEKERAQLAAKARAEQEQILERAKREIDAERERAVTELRREAVDLSLAAASKLIERQLDDVADRKIVEDYLSALGKKH